MRKMIALLLILIFLPAIVTGCYDKREVDDMAYVIAIGFDKGVTDKLRLTLQMISLKEEGGGNGSSKGSAEGGGEGNETTVITVDCPGPAVGLNMLNIVTSRQLNLMHAKLLVFSDEIAKSDEFAKYVTAMARYREIRRSMGFIITRGKAEDFIKENKTLLSKHSAKAVQLIMYQANYTGFFPRVRLFNFYNEIKSTMEQPVAILADINTFKKIEEPGQGEQQEPTGGGEYLAGEVPRRGGLRREYFGGAVFHGARMVGEITGSEVRVRGMVTNEFKRGFFDVQDPLNPESVVSFDVRPARKPKIKVNLRGDTPEINVKIRLEGDILSIPSGVHYEDPKLKPVLEQAFEQEIKNQIDSLITKAQNEFHSDIFKFGCSAVYHFPTIEDWESYAWHKKFPEAKINTEVDFIIRRTGILLKSAPVIITGEESGE